ncbi:MAG: spore coat protein CotJB [Eubacteriales bacterium]|nr:spore coat protein CotJB [Eubacteriales bacterium]
MSKSKLLKRLSALGFAMYECRLFCDTHPDDQEALELLNSYKKKYEAVKAEFEKEFGPLTLNGYNSDDWLNDPWPWDNSAG